MTFSSYHELWLLCHRSKHVIKFTFLFPKFQLTQSMFHYLHYCLVDSFNKLRWSQDGYSAILRGGVELDASGLNIKVRSEAYYFIFTKIQFRHKERASNK